MDTWNKNTDSDEKMRLEIQGEKAANIIRVILWFVFLAGMLSAYRTGIIKGVEVFYYLGLGIFATPLVFSIIVLRLGRYAPWMKYYAGALEILSYFIVNLGYLYLATPQEWLTAINSTPRHGVWYILIGMAALRFSPRVALIAGFAAAGAFGTLCGLLIARPEIQLIFSGVTKPGSTEIHFLTPGLGIVFMSLMGVTIALGARFIRGLLDTARGSENDARTNLNNITNLVAEGARIAEDLDSAVKNIRGVTLANEELSRDQLASIEETSAAMEQMGASIQSIAEQARVQDVLCDKNAQSMRTLDEMTRSIESLSKQANEQGEKTLERTLLGEKALENALEGIQRIQEGSVQVAEIVTVINGIADKTNLLALNAAIEAARAGAEGRGFSVVADEVGKLADLSSNNSRIIENLILETRNDTELGVQSIEETVKSLKGVTAGIKSIVDSIGEVYSLVARQSVSAGEVTAETQKIQTIALDMKNATSEQLEGTREIMTAVDSINSVADKFARNYSQLMDAAEVLSRTNSRMNEQIGRFGLND